MPHIYDLNPHLRPDEAPKKPKRARKADGTLKADDPSTPENEAWESGVAPKKRGRPKKNK